MDSHDHLVARLRDGAADPDRRLDSRPAEFIPEVARQYWIAMTPEQRAGYGLPASGWGRALFGDAWGDDPRDQA